MESTATAAVGKDFNKLKCRETIKKLNFFNRGVDTGQGQGTSFLKNNSKGKFPHSPLNSLLPCLPNVLSYSSKQVIRQHYATKLSRFSAISNGIFESQALYYREFLIVGTKTIVLSNPGSKLVNQLLIYKYQIYKNLHFF